MRQKVIILVLLIACIVLAGRLYFVGRGPAPGRERASARLDARLAEVHFRRMPMAQAIDSLAQLAKAKIQVRWADLDPAGINPQTPVSVDLWDVPLETALRIIFDRSAAGPSNARWETREGVVIVGGDSLQQDPQLMTCATYDVGELVARSAALQGGWDHSRSIPPGQTTLTLAQLQKGAVQAHAEALVQMVTTIAAPESWNTTGGPGSCRYFGGRLVIQHFPSVHRDVTKFLDKLRGQPDWSAWAAPATQPTVSPLSRPIQLPAMENQPLETVLSRIAGAARLDIIPRWNALEVVGIDRKTRITLRAYEGPLLGAMERISAACTAATGGQMKFSYRMEQGVLVFACGDVLPAYVEFRTFDVRDLLRADIEESRRWARDMNYDPNSYAAALHRIVTVLEEDPELSERVRSWAGRIIIQHRPEVLDRAQAKLDQMRDRLKSAPPSTLPGGTP